VHQWAQIRFSNLILFPFFLILLFVVFQEADASFLVPTPIGAVNSATL
jgi:hypothetical protein